MDLSQQEERYKDSYDGDSVPSYCIPAFNPRSYMEKEDKERGLGEHAQEKREYDKFPSPVHRSAYRSTAIQIAAGMRQYSTAQLEQLKQDAEEIYQWITKQD